MTLARLSPFMAAAVGRLSGRPGVVLVTSGPGTSNLATGLLTATTEGDPMVALCGAVPRANAAEMLKLAPSILLTNDGGDGHAEQVFLRASTRAKGRTSSSPSAASRSTKRGTCTETDMPTRTSSSRRSSRRSA